MLMRPSRSLATGAAVTVHLDTNDSNGVDASFVVSEDAPAVTERALATGYRLLVPAFESDVPMPQPKAK
jgi:hypothetical protein